MATSLSIGESRRKHVGILKIHGRSFELKKLALKTVRPFLMDEVSLDDEGLSPHDERGIKNFLEEKVGHASRRVRISAILSMFPPLGGRFNWASHGRMA